jgi:hypothetical protein
MSPRKRLRGGGGYIVYAELITEASIRCCGLKAAPIHAALPNHNALTFDKRGRVIIKRRVRSWMAAMGFRATVWVFPPIKGSASHVYAFALCEEMREAEQFCRKRMNEGQTAHADRQFRCSIVSSDAIATYAAPPRVQPSKRVRIRA